MNLSPCGAINEQGSRDPYRTLLDRWNPHPSRCRPAYLPRDRRGEEATHGSAPRAERPTAARARRREWRRGGLHARNGDSLELVSRSSFALLPDNRGGRGDRRVIRGRTCLNSPHAVRPRPTRRANARNMHVSSTSILHRGHHRTAGLPGLASARFQPRRVRAT